MQFDVFQCCFSDLLGRYRAVFNLGLFVPHYPVKIFLSNVYLVSPKLGCSVCLGGTCTTPQNVQTSGKVTTGPPVLFFPHTDQCSAEQSSCREANREMTVILHCFAFAFCFLLPCSANSSILASSTQLFLILPDFSLLGLPTGNLNWAISRDSHRAHLISFPSLIYFCSSLPI